MSPAGGICGGPPPAPLLRVTPRIRMELRRIRALRGPNVWARVPVLEAEVDLGGLGGSSGRTVPGFIDRLLAWVPSLAERPCPDGRPGGSLERPREGTDLARVLAHLTLELQSLAGTPVGFGSARED